MKCGPCKNCTKRHIACHDTCQDYGEWHKEWMRIRANRIAYLSKFLQTDKRLQNKSKSMKKFYKRNVEAQY